MTQRHKIDSNGFRSVVRARPRLILSVCWLSSDVMNHICPKSATPWQFSHLFFVPFSLFPQTNYQLTSRLLKYSRKASKLSGCELPLRLLFEARLVSCPSLILIFVLRQEVIILWFHLHSLLFLLMDQVKSAVYKVIWFSQMTRTFQNKIFHIYLHFTCDLGFPHAFSNDCTCFVKIKIFAIKKLADKDHIPDWWWSSSWRAMIAHLVGVSPLTWWVNSYPWQVIITHHVGDHHRSGMWWSHSWPVIIKSLAGNHHYCLFGVN